MRGQPRAPRRNLDPRTDNDTKYAAFYYPWIFVSDPRSGARNKIPPGGAVCGIYALTDNTRGVFKAPANEVVAGAIDLEYDIDHGTQEVLNPRGRQRHPAVPRPRHPRVGRPHAVERPAVEVRERPAPLHLPRGVDLLLAPSGWSSSRTTRGCGRGSSRPSRLFLRTQWREGALFGEKEEEAFSVAVGRETMTEDDILNGRLIVEIGIAPVRPAEFVIFRVFQKTQEAKARSATTREGAPMAARQDPLRNFRYRLEIDGIEQAGFAEVAIGDLSTEPDRVPRGRRAHDRPQAQRADQVRQRHAQVGHHRLHRAGRLAPAGRRRRHAARRRPAHAS